MEQFNYYKEVIFKKYAQFEGRSRRAEFWYFTLFNVLISMALGFLDSALGLGLGSGEFGQSNGVLGSLYGLAVLIPGLAVAVRRLHDTGKSGWNLLWAFTIIGIFYVLYLYVIEGDKGTNDYGADPKGGDLDLEDHLIED